MLHLMSEPMPSSYAHYVIQVVSLAYNDWVDYRRLPGGTDDDLAQRLLLDHRSMHPSRRFRLVKRQIRDTTVTE